MLCYITHVMLCCITHDKLSYITHDMLCYITYFMLCYVMTSKFVFHFNAIVKIPFYLLWLRNIKLHLFIKQIINFSVEETLNI